TPSRAQSRDAVALNQKMVELFIAGKYADAIQVGQRALTLYEKTAGPSSVATAIPIFNLGESYKELGRLDDAQLLHKRGRAIRERGLRADHPDLVRSMSSLVAVYVSQSRYAEAEPLMKRMLAVRQKALGPDHPDVADAINSLALLYQNQGRHADAEPLSR